MVLGGRALRPAAAGARARAWEVKTLDRTRIKAGLAGAGLLASLGLTRLVTAADATAVTFAGREFFWACPVRSLLGLPCPSCGLTRSVVFTLHGEWGRAAAMNPAGPLLVLGLLALGLLLLLAACARPSDALVRKVVVSASAYGCLTAVVLLVQWVRALS